jgi:hypothetical protein
MLVRMIDVIGFCLMPPDKSGGYRMIDVICSCATYPNELGRLRIIDVFGFCLMPPDLSGDYRIIDVICGCAVFERLQDSRCCVMFYQTLLNHKNCQRTNFFTLISDSLRL